MRPSEPRAATWLLKYFCQNEALIGDLLEEYRQGRSASWYGRQVLMAILVGCGGEVRANKLLAVRAVVTGWAASILFYYLMTLPVHKLYWWATAGLRANRNEMWWSHYYTYPVAFVPCIGGFLSGWLVARLYRPNRVAMVYVFVVFMLLAQFPEVFRLATDSLTNSRFLPYLLDYLLRENLFLASILFGGLRRTHSVSPLSRRSLSKSE